MSVEERLDRIERILESLDAHGGARAYIRRDDGQSSYKPAKPMVMSDYQVMVADEAKRAAEEAMRSAEAGKRAAEAGQRAAEKAMRDAHEYMNRNYDRSSGDRGKFGAEGFQRKNCALPPQRPRGAGDEP